MQCSNYEVIAVENGWMVMPGSSDRNTYRSLEMAYVFTNFTSLQRWLKDNLVPLERKQLAEVK